MIVVQPSTNPVVNDALDTVEQDMAAAARNSVRVLNAVLDTNPADATTIHTQLARLHTLIADVDGNHTARERHRNLDADYDRGVITVTNTDHRHSTDYPQHRA